MKGTRLIEAISLRGLLSYGAHPCEVTLTPLNVLIGPNASGKSNFIAALGLLRAAPDDLSAPFRQGGGAEEWLWKGDGNESACLSATFALPKGRGPLIHSLRFSVPKRVLWIEEERIDWRREPAASECGFFMRVTSEHAKALEASPPTGLLGHRTNRTEIDLDWSKFSDAQSVLSQLRDPMRYPEIEYIARSYKEMMFYVDWDMGRSCSVRRPQPADLPGDFLLENASNLALVLNDLEHQPGVKRVLIDNLRKLYPRLTDVTGRVIGGTVLPYFHEEGLQQPLSAARASDGLLRYLCLLTILCHPSPPPLICIEEPELGLHPDVISVLGDLLIDASQRTQLIVTTHSDLLVSAVSDVPESVLVCERDEQGTQLRRLEKDKLKEWLEEYSLGDLWLMGEIGGTTT